MEVHYRRKCRESSPDRAKVCMKPGVKPMIKKVQIVYYLSRNGHLEHPHYMEVTHLANHPLRLKGTFPFRNCFMCYTPFFFTNCLFDSYLQMLLIDLLFLEATACHLFILGLANGTVLCILPTIFVIFFYSFGYVKINFFKISKL